MRTYNILYIYIILCCVVYSLSLFYGITALLVTLLLILYLLKLF